MPEKVQSIPGADPQIEEIVKDTVSASRGGTHYGAETFKGAVTFEGLVTLMALANLAIDLILKKANPALRLIGTEGSAKDWRMVEDAGAVKVQENTGSEGAPTWTTRFSVDATGITAGEKDPVATGLAVDQVIKTDGDFTTTSTTFVDVTGLSITATTGARRCLVFLNLQAANNVGAPSVSSNRIDVVVNGTSLTGGAGVNVFASNGNNFVTRSAVVLTAVLSAGSNTIKLQAKTSTATLTIKATSGDPAFFGIAEVP